MSTKNKEMGAKLDSSDSTYMAAGRSELSTAHPKSGPAKYLSFVTTLRFVGVVKCDYSIRYAYCDANGEIVEMASKDFYKAIPFMVRGVLHGEFRSVIARGKTNISFIGEIS